MGGALSLPPYPCHSCFYPQFSLARLYARHAAGHVVPQLQNHTLCCTPPSEEQNNNPPTVALGRSLPQRSYPTQVGDGGDIETVLCSATDLVAATPLPKPGDTLTHASALGGMRVRHAETAETGTIVNCTCTIVKCPGTGRTRLTWPKRVLWDRSGARCSDPFCSNLVLVGGPHGYGWVVVSDPNVLVGLRFH
jgi:hypothetical protein